MGKEYHAEYLRKITTTRRNEFWEEGSPKLEAVLEGIADFVKAAETNGVDKKAALSYVCGVVPFSKLRDRIPGLSYSYYRGCVHWKAKYGPGQKPAQTPIVRENTDTRENMGYFIEHCASPEVVSILPCGTSTITDSHGKRKIAAVVRTSRNEHTIRQYETKLKQKGLFQTRKLSRSSYIRVLNVCTAKVRKAVLGLDYYTFRGLQGLDELKCVLNELKKLAVDMDLLNEIEKGIEEIRLYLKTDFKAHIKPKSAVPDHCIQYSLSDPKNPRFNTPCDHEHNMRCKRCEQVKGLLGQIQAIVAAAEFPTAQLKNLCLYRTAKAIKSINEWRRHILRTSQQEIVKSNLLNRMKPKACFITLDFAMRFLPIAGKEEQTSWYKKTGIPWHISVVYVNYQDEGLSQAHKELLEPGFNQRIFVHVFDKSANQDSATVFALVKHMLQEIKKELPWIEEAYLRSDNAAYYHSSAPVASMFTMKEQTGIKVAGWSFSESQAGKGPCDREAARIKAHVGYFVNQNNLATTPAEFVHAIGSMDGLSSVSTFYGQANVPSKPKKRIPGISDYYDFRYKYEIHPVRHAQSASKRGRRPSSKNTPDVNLNMALMVWRN